MFLAVDMPGTLFLPMVATVLLVGYFIFKIIINIYKGYYEADKGK